MSWWVAANIIESDNHYNHYQDDHNHHQHNKILMKIIISTVIHGPCTMSAC